MWGRVRNKNTLFAQCAHLLARDKHSQLQVEIAVGDPRDGKVVPQFTWARCRRQFPCCWRQRGQWWRRRQPPRVRSTSPWWSASSRASQHHRLNLYQHLYHQLDHQHSNRGICLPIPPWSLPGSPEPEHDAPSQSSSPSSSCWPWRFSSLTSSHWTRTKSRRCSSSSSSSPPSFPCSSTSLSWLQGGPSFRAMLPPQWSDAYWFALWKYQDLLNFFKCICLRYIWICSFTEDHKLGRWW